MSTETPETPAPKASRLKMKTIPYTPPALEALTPISVAGVMVYHDPIPDTREDETGKVTIRFFGADRLRPLKKIINLPLHLDAEEVAAAMQSHARGFLMKLLGGVIPEAQPEVVEESDLDLLEDPASPDPA